jgi:NhaP-type Na+/H+ or K+/H+ antiporter
MVFVACGFLLGPGGTGLLVLAPETEPVKRLTELTLALLLFADASTLKWDQVREDIVLPARLLTIGLLLTIAAGAAVALILFPREGLPFACLLGAMLAPTDAALGLPIFNNPQVPVRIRRALNIESGLNDGIATPFVLLFLAFAAAEQQPLGGWLTGALSEIVIAVVVGSAVGLLGGWLLAQVMRRQWTAGGPLQIGILALALAAYAGSVAAGGNGFIAAFVGGISFGSATRNEFVEPTEFTETAGSLLSLLVWVVFGSVLVNVISAAQSTWQPLLYALLSLTIVRMGPVALALRKTGLRRDTVALMGWFGPRGLASVVFTLLALQKFGTVNRPVDMLLATAGWTILLSVVGHGLSAVPLSAWYARRLAAAGQPLAELANLPEMHQRRQSLAKPLA